MIGDVLCKQTNNTFVCLNCHKLKMACQHSVVSSPKQNSTRTMYKKINLFSIYFKNKFSGVSYIYLFFQNNNSEPELQSNYGTILPRIFTNTNIFHGYFT